MQLASFDAAAFLRDDWQQRPVVIRNPWATWHNPLTPDELAGLACEDGSEARLIVRSRRWRVDHGPFAPKRFAKLGKHPWTLLVQAVDHVVPAVAALREAFDFVPNWRVDDVMVSYASDGGGVGPHFDQYDVFLIQGLGRRRWRIGARCTDATPLAPHDDLRLLAAFEPTEEWLLEPGDMLYVPPGVAHDGVAEGDDCMTYSVGFRAPSRSELIAHWCDDVLSRLTDDDRYADPGLAMPANPGEIAAPALDALHALVTTALGDRDGFARWFGEHATMPKSEHLTTAPRPIGIASLRKRLASGVLRRNAASRFAFVRHGPAAVTLFVDGEAFACTGAAAALAEALGADVRAAMQSEWLADPPALELVQALIARGAVVLQPVGK